MENAEELSKATAELIGVINENLKVLTDDDPRAKMIKEFKIQLCKYLKVSNDSFELLDKFYKKQDEREELWNVKNKRPKKQRKVRAVEEEAIRAYAKPIETLNGYLNVLPDDDPRVPKMKQLRILLLRTIESTHELFEVMHKFDDDHRDEIIRQSN